MSVENANALEVHLGAVDPFFNFDYWTTIFLYDGSDSILGVVFGRS